MYFCRPVSLSLRMIPKTVGKLKINLQLYLSFQYILLYWLTHWTIFHSKTSKVRDCRVFGCKSWNVGDSCPVLMVAHLVDVEFSYNGKPIWTHQHSILLKLLASPAELILILVLKSHIRPHFYGKPKTCIFWDRLLIKWGSLSTC